MGFTDVISMIAALAVTLGLFGVAVWAYRKFAPAGLLPLAASRQRRLAVVESLMLDANRRLVLIRFDGEERLILLGEGRALPTRGAGGDRP